MSEVRETMDVQDQTDVSENFKQVKIPHSSAALSVGRYLQCYAIKTMLQ